MTHILVKSGRVIVQGGRVLTSQGGAPCCCDIGGDCWIIVLACNCDDLAQARRIRLPDPRIDAAWPYAERRAGVVVSIAGVCYRFLAAMQDPPDTMPILSFDHYDGITYSSCDESPCRLQPPCSCVSGFEAFFGTAYSGSPGAVYECVDPIEVCGIDRIEATISGRADEKREIVDSSLTPFETIIELEVSGTIVSGRQLIDVSGIGTSVGFDDDGAWDYSEEYADPSDSSVANAFYSRSVSFSLGPSLALLSGNAPVDSSAGIRQGDPASLACCCNTTETLSTADRVTRSSVSLSLLRSEVDVFFEVTAYTGTDRSQVSTITTRSARYTVTRRIFLTDGTVIEDDDCDRPVGGGGNPGGPTQGPGGTDVGNRPGGGGGSTTGGGLPFPGDPALQAELARQAQMRTGQFPGRCPSCGG